MANSSTQLPEPVSEGHPHFDRVLQALADLAGEAPVTIRVRGDCMLPGLADGERVQVSRDRMYWPGDVVAFVDRKGRLTVHRAIGWRPARGGWRLLTQADAAHSADSSIPRSRIVGRVHTPVPWTSRLRALGRLSRLLITGFRAFPVGRDAAD